MDINKLALFFTAVIVLGFFISGIFDILDYFIVAALLFIGFGLLAGYMVWMVFLNSENKKNHLK